MIDFMYSWIGYLPNWLRAVLFAISLLGLIAGIFLFVLALFEIE